MLKVGITGGIGSGKTVVCQVFRTLGIPVFNADDAARYLMENNTVLINNIRRLLGNDVYSAGKLLREKISTIIFKHPEKLQQLNALVHPATIAYSREWMEQQNARYVIKEAALFFESNSYKEMDLMLGVYAPEELRVQRAINRGRHSRAQVLAIMEEQMDDEEKMKRCNYVIINDDLHAILPQILSLHELLTEQANKT
jgi:dephospho-CoA kinase